MNRLKFSLLPSILVAILASLLLRSSGVEAASISKCKTWNVVSSPNASSENNVFTALSIVSTNDVWAAGNTTNNRVDQTLIEQWNGTSWNIVPSPNVPGSNNNDLSGIGAVSANDIWTVGGYIDGNGILKTLIEQWNGTNWNIVPSPNAGNGDHLIAITVVSANDIWAVGFSNFPTNPQTLIEQWDGTSWNIVSSPNAPGSTQDLLTGVTAISANDIWAVGYYFNSGNVYQTLIEQWNGTSWNVVSSPDVGSTNNFLYGVASTRRSNTVWAVGLSTNDSGVYQTLIEQWNGTSWGVIPSPDAGSGQNLLNGVVSSSSKNAWAVGQYVNSNGIAQTLIEQWKGVNWSIVSSPNVGSGNNSLLGVAQVPHNKPWTVGYSSNSGGPLQTLTESHC